MRERMAKGDCVRCIHSVVCKYRSINEQPWIEEHCKLAAREERPHGKWVEIENEHGSYCGCSNCKWENEHWQTQWVACPNCGADMRKEGGEK